MAAMLRRLPALAGLAGVAAIGAELAGHRAFARLVRRDVQALRARACPGRAGTVIEEMLEDLPDPVRRYLRCTGVVGQPFPGTIRLRQKGTMRFGQRWLPLDAEEHYSVQPPGFVWAGTARLGPLPVARARDMYAGGQGRLQVKVASLWPVADASGAQMDQGEMMRYLSEMIWFPAAFLAGNISFEAVDDSSARVTLTDHSRTATGTLVFDAASEPPLLGPWPVARRRTREAFGDKNVQTPVLSVRRRIGPFRRGPAAGNPAEKIICAHEVIIKYQSRSRHPRRPQRSRKTAVKAAAPRAANWGAETRTSSSGSSRAAGFTR
jgi:hypothetical protein